MERLAGLQLKPGGEKGKGQKQREASERGQTAEYHSSHVPSLPAENKNQQQIQTSEEHFGEKAAFQQADQ